MPARMDGARLLLVRWLVLIARSSSRPTTLPWYGKQNLSHRAGTCASAARRGKLRPTRDLDSVTDPEPQRVAPAFTTGGGGFSFEDRAGTWVVAAMLAGQSPVGAGVD